MLAFGFASALNSGKSEEWDRLLYIFGGANSGIYEENFFLLFFLSESLDSPDFYDMGDDEDCDFFY